MVYRKTLFYSIIIVIIMKLSKFCDTQNMTGKIVGGDFAKNKQFPHAVYMNMKCDPLNFICGSSVLNQRILITAAHCVHGCNIKGNHRIDAFGGIIDLTKLENSITRQIKDLVVHKQYNEDMVLNDIALVELQQPFPLNDFIKRIAIFRHFPIYTQGIVAGWGLVEEQFDKRRPNLKFVQQRLMSYRRCSKYVYLSPGMLCAGSANPKEDHPSSGDSGSGLISDGHIHIGVVSFRDMGTPALLVYSNTSFFYDWIITNAKNLTCED